MATDLKGFCAQIKTMGHYQPWVILALLASKKNCDFSWLANEYAKYEIAAKLEQRALPPRSRLRKAIKEVLQDAHRVVLIDGAKVHLTAYYHESDRDEIERLCVNALHGHRLPSPKFVPGGLPSLGKRK